MKILHLPSTFWPDSTGGKEVFVYYLVKAQPNDDHRVLIHRDGPPSEYDYDGIHTYVLPNAITSDARRSYFSHVYDDLPGFDKLLDEFQPDLIHFHDFSGGASLSHLRVCKTKNIRTVLTYHSPGQSCLQRALIQDGKRPCSGKIDLTICTRCRYIIRGVQPGMASLMARIPSPSMSLNKIFLRGDTQLFSDSWHEFHNNFDAIQVHARWVIDLLGINNVPKSKIRFVQMGGHPSLPAMSKNQSGALRFVFIGRCTDIKGVHLFIDAIKKLPPDPAVEVHFFGPYWEDDYGHQMQAKIGDDRRFMKPRLIPHNDVLKELQHMDVCVIPSLWPETGPYTVFDAFASHAVVLGTNYAGIAEKVRDGVDGLLFEWGNVDDLYIKLKRLYDDRQYLAALRSNIIPNKTFSEFGVDMRSLYQEIMKG
ncbi:MAG TPA: glycosyltransferase [Cyclobacteriaceae bacterium]|nr:glycosyltransferase [Cyclobacteriaceae bacterium]